ncbi:DUF6011 domain-containing protein [Streptosporangium amethystogenes subsp. fukuiense]|uniref:DUF6011 domain-containing protein n=1 Tax=Streptosporangium amethystogenes subsp. fukuiense TaxID=698418 RepID=A0ABW2T6J0_9ACTN
MTLFAEEGTPRPVKCGACPRMLTDPVSIARGFGPCCAKNLGLLPEQRRRGSSGRVRAGGSVEGQEDLLAEETT